MDAKYHSRAKDWLLTSWLKIATRVQRAGRRDLCFVDLYAGDGVVRATLPNGRVVEWPGSALRMARAAADAERPVRVIVNEQDSERLDALTEALPKSVGVWRFCGDANELVSVILRQLEPRDYNFVFVDPFSHSEIRLDTLRKISALSQREVYNGTWFTRRPEIMFTFMTYGLALSMKADAIHTIDDFFCGFDWRPFVERARSEGRPIQVGFVEALMQAMRTFYPTGEGESPQAVWPYEVRVGKGQIAYYILFWSTHPLAAKIYPSLLPYGRKFQDNIVTTLVDLRRQARILRTRKLRPLDDYDETEQ